MNSKTQRIAAEWFLRVALSTSFLTSLGDRYGVFGKYGTPGVTWGSWEGFLFFAGKLTFWLPGLLRPAAAYTSTLLEIILSILLLIPFGTRLVASVAGALLTVYAVSLAFAYGFLASSSYSVWTAAGGAFLLAAVSTRATPGADAPIE